uniref:Uncharacterized protein n=1 Tax=Arundo donax TaxID=35708 RepID=A0A0A9GES3_ARUDO
MHPAPKPCFKLLTIALMSLSIPPRSRKALGASFQDSSDCLNSFHFLCSKFAAMASKTGSSPSSLWTAPLACSFKTSNSFRMPVSKSSTLDRTIS